MREIFHFAEFHKFCAANPECRIWMTKYRGAVRFSVRHGRKTLRLGKSVAKRALECGFLVLRQAESTPDICVFVPNMPEYAPMRKWYGLDNKAVIIPVGQRYSATSPDANAEILAAAAEHMKSLRAP